MFDQWFKTQNSLSPTSYGTSPMSSPLQDSEDDTSTTQKCLEWINNPMILDSDLEKTFLHHVPDYCFYLYFRPSVIFIICKEDNGVVHEKLCDISATRYTDIWNGNSSNIIGRKIRDELTSRYSNTAGYAIISSQGRKYLDGNPYCSLYEKNSVYIPLEAARHHYHLVIDGNLLKIDYNVAKNNTLLKVGSIINSINRIAVSSPHQYYKQLSLVAGKNCEFVLVGFEKTLQRDGVVVQVAIAKGDRRQMQLQTRSAFGLSFVNTPNQKNDGSLLFSVNGSMLWCKTQDQRLAIISKDMRVVRLLSVSSDEYTKLKSAETILTGTASYDVVRVAQTILYIIEVFVFLREEGDVTTTALPQLLRKSLLPFMFVPRRSVTAAQMYSLVEDLIELISISELSLRAEFCFYTLCMLCEVKEGRVCWKAVEALGMFFKSPLLFSVIENDEVLLFIVRMSKNEDSVIRSASVELSVHFLMWILSDDNCDGLSNTLARKNSEFLDELQYQHLLEEIGCIILTLGSDSDNSVSKRLVSTIREESSVILDAPSCWGWLLQLVESLAQNSTEHRVDVIELGKVICQYWSDEMTLLTNDEDLFEISTCIERQERLRNVFAKLGKDVNQDVRLSLVSSFPDICHSLLSQKTVIKDLEERFKAFKKRTMEILASSLSNFICDDKYPTVQLEGCKNLYNCCQYFTPDVVDLLSTELMPVFESDIKNCALHGSSGIYDTIHHILASELLRTSSLMSPKFVSSTVVSFILSILLSNQNLYGNEKKQHTKKMIVADDDEEQYDTNYFRGKSRVVHSHLISCLVQNLDCIGNVIGKDEFIKTFIPIFVSPLGNHSDFTIREAVARNLLPLKKWLGEEVFDQHLQKLRNDLSKDSISAVHTVAIKCFER